MGDFKWLRGIRWQEMGQDLILHHEQSHDGKEIELDLKSAPLVMAEIKKQFPERPSQGPIIICEPTGLPWTAQEFRRWWRKIANEAGVPKGVKNRHSRIGDEDDDD